MALSSRESEVYEFGPFRLDVPERLLAREGRPVLLAPKVFDTLVALARGGGRLLTKDELMAELWPDTTVEEANLVVNISALRKALGEGGGDRYIETVPKRGYRLAAQIRAPGGEAADGANPRAEAARPPDHNAPATTRPGDTEGAARPSADQHRSRRGLITAAACGLAVACLASIIYLLLDRRAAAESHFQAMRIERLTSTGNVGNAALSPDGNHFVYTLLEEEGRSLWVRQVAASKAVRLLAPARGVRFLGLTFSPDGESVYYVTSDDAGASALYRVPMLGGPSQRLLDDIDKPVAFSPDGRRFAFVRRDAATGASKVLIARAGGEVERTLAARREPASFLWPAWSPDGESIACSARDADAGGEYASIVELRLSDGAERRVSGKRWHWAGQLAWPRDGGLLVAATDPDVGMHNQIWEVPTGGGRPKRVTNDLNSYVGLSASADADRLLAVVADRVSNIWIAPLDGGAPRQVTATRYDGYWGLSWMSDGRLLYESSGANQIQFWAASADGSAQTQLTDDPHPKAMPAASRDGRHIVFASARAGPMNLWRAGADGSNPQQLTFGHESDAYPALSPDASWVVYEATRAGVPALWKVPLAGGYPTQLTGAPATRPAVSPCGRYVAYWAGDTAAGATVEVIGSEGGEPLRRLNVPAQPVGDRRALRWAAAGGALSYVDTRSGVSNVWSVPVGGGTPRRLTDFRSELIFDFDFSPDGRSLALSRGHFTRDAVIINDLRPTTLR